MEKLKHRQNITGIGCSGTTNPGATRKPDNPLKGIQNPIPRKLDNPLKGIQNKVPKGIRNQWPIMLTIQA